MVVLSAIFTGLATTHPALAVDGLPGSPQFGYGARLDIQGQGIRQSIDLASGMNFSWLLVEFDWSFYWPDPDALPLFKQLDSVTSLAGEKNINLVISLTNPPAWAMTAQGPSPEKTSQLVIELARRYSGIVLAFELFPSANTVTGWAASPSPKGYADLLLTVSSSLTSAGCEVNLIATLSPLLPNDTRENIPDDVFLHGLYASGWQTSNSILGIRFLQISGDPLSLPSDTSLPVLRHYEDLRQILIENNDGHRLIWVTGFAWPKELSQDIDPIGEQTDWLLQAYRLLTAQLYIGAAFFEQINPNTATENSSSLLLSDTSLHPVCSTLSQLTNPTNVIIFDQNKYGLFLSRISKIISK